MGWSGWVGSMNSANANPGGRPVSRSTGSTTCDGGATAPKCARRSASVVAYDRLPTNKRTANQLSPKLKQRMDEPGREARDMASANTQAADPVEKPYPKSLRPGKRLHYNPPFWGWRHDPLSHAAPD